MLVEIFWFAFAYTDTLMHHGLDLYHRFLDFLTAYNNMLVLNSYSSSFRKGFHRVDSLFAFFLSLLLRTVFTLAILMGNGML